MMASADMMAEPADAGVDMMMPDAMLLKCFSDGAQLIELFTSEPLEGLERLWAGVDTNGDQIGELAISQRLAGDTVISIMKGRPLKRWFSHGRAGQRGLHARPMAKTIECVRSSQ